MKNPEIDAIDRYDPFLNKKGAIEAGIMYAGGENPSNYLVSPINGDLHGLGEITIFMGTNDILAPDARKLVTLGSKQEIKINYIEGANMIHVYPIFKFPEAKKAFGEILTIMNEDGRI